MYFRRLTTIVFSALCAALSCGLVLGAPAVSNVTAASSSVGRYDVFTLDFAIVTVASNYSWPYDVAPPASIPPGVGVTVDGLFSKDNWVTNVTVPGFYYQDYVLQSGGSSEYATPVGGPCWCVRFAPTAIGTWRYKIRVQDSSGTTTYPSSADDSFGCVASQNRGFLRASPTDSRYFETSDGTPLLGPGVNANLQTTAQADSLLKTYGDNGVRLVRWWMDYRGWQNPFGGGDVATSGGPQWSYSLAMSTAGGRKSGDRYSAVLKPGKNTYQSAYTASGSLYRLTGYVKTSDVPGDPGKGGVAYIGTSTANAVQGTRDWTPITVDYIPTKSEAVNVGCRNTAASGTVYFDDLSLKSSSDGGQTWSSECLLKGDIDFENYVDLCEAWKVDRIFQSAKQHGVYLKTVISEKQDSSLGCISADGSTGARSDDNFYASDNHPSRWLQKAWWRYMTARWGCYTSLHSWELCNEGDPFSGKHYNAANALATYVHLVDPNKAMCTTSFWHSIPADFWKSSSCDYLDVHEYVGPTSPSTGSHGPRFFAWSDPGTSSSNASVTLPMVQADGTLDLDSNQVHTGSKALKLLANAGTGNVGRAFMQPEYHVGVDPSRSYTLRYWAKAENVGTPGGGLGWVRPGVNVAWSKAYHENDWLGATTVNAELGTYTWRKYEQSGIRPPAAANTANIASCCSCSSDHAGTFWVDDIEFIDETTGKNLYVDGGFEGDRIDYDTALAVKKYGVFLNSYGNRIGKLAMWSETGIRGANVYGSPYKGYGYTEENQQLVDDTTGIYLKKMVWAHIGPDNPNMLLWWTDNISKKGFWNYFKAYQSFMSCIPLSNGHYVAANAVTTDPALRAWGQKDLTNNHAHLWIDNAPYTWKNVVDGVSVPAVTGTVTVPSLKDGKYTVEWWDTSTGAITKTEELTCSGGNLVLSVQNLQSDIACKIYPVQAKIDVKVTVPSSQVVPGQTVMVTLEFTNTGETEAKNITVTARVPAQMIYVAGSAEASGGNYNATTGVIIWTVDSVAAHQTGSRSFQAKVQ